MLRKDVLLFCGFRLLPDFCKLLLSFPPLSSVLRDLSDICDTLWRDGFNPPVAVFSASNLTSEWVWALVRDPEDPTNFPTSSVLWYFPMLFLLWGPFFPFSFENSAILARTPDNFSSNVTIWNENELWCEIFNNSISYLLLDRTIGSNVVSVKTRSGTSRGFSAEELLLVVTSTSHQGRINIVLGELIAVWRKSGVGGWQWSRVCGVLRSLRLVEDHQTIHGGWHIWNRR